MAPPPLAQSPAPTPRGTTFGGPPPQLQAPHSPRRTQGEKECVSVTLVSPIGPQKRTGNQRCRGPKGPNRGQSFSKMKGVDVPHRSGWVGTSTGPIEPKNNTHKNHYTHLSALRNLATVERKILRHIADTTPDPLKVPVLFRISSASASAAASRRDRPTQTKPSPDVSSKGRHMLIRKSDSIHLVSVMSLNSVGIRVDATHKPMRPGVRSALLPCRRADANKLLGCENFKEGQGPALSRP